MRRLQLRLAGVVGLFLVVAWFASCNGGALSRPGPVLLVGDSIFFNAGDELTFALSSEGWDATVEGRPGAGIRGGGFEPEVDWPSELPGMVDRVDPQVVVVELGTNGCEDCESLSGAIDDVMEALDGVDSVLWLTVRTDGKGGSEGLVVNAALEDATDRWPELELLRYDRWFAGRPDLVPPDDDHPTQAGERELARHVVRALDDRAGSQVSARGAVVLIVVVAALVMLRQRKRR